MNKYTARLTLDHCVYVRLSFESYYLDISEVTKMAENLAEKLGLTLIEVERVRNKD